jgi:hypothetical protein
VPDGDVRDLLDEAGNAFVVRPKDVEGMARVIEQQADGAARPPTNEELLARYERRELTRRLVAVLDSV